MVKYIIGKLDSNKELIIWYSEIKDSICICKWRLIKVFKELREKNILMKIWNKSYRFKEEGLDNM